MNVSKEEEGWIWKERGKSERLEERGGAGMMRVERGGGGGGVDPFLPLTFCL